MKHDLEDIEYSLKAERQLFEVKIKHPRIFERDGIIHKVHPHNKQIVGEN
jgi:hypothetical protein